MTETLSKPPRFPAVVHAVIVHHRGMEMLEDCLRTLDASEGVELNVVVVENGCEEGLPSRVETSPRLHSTKPAEAVGFSEANNIGARWALENLGAPDYFYFINNDTESHPEAIARQVKACRNHGAAVAGPLTLIHAAPDHLNSLGIQVTEDAGAWDLGIGRPVEEFTPLPGAQEQLAVTGSALLIDAEVFAQLDGWSEVYEWYYEDIDLCLRAWKQGHRVIHVSDAEIRHRISATMTEGSSRKQFYFRRNRLLIGVLHWPPRILAKLLWRAIYHEILRNPWHATPMHREALGDIIRRLPTYLRWRRRYRGDDSWQRFLHKIGSVPPISLPELTTASDASMPGAEADGREELHTLLGDDPWQAARAFAKAAQLDEHRHRLLVVGWGPLPTQPARMHYAPCQRTWQFAKALRDDGHRVCVLSAQIPGAVDEQQSPAREQMIDDILVYSLDRGTFEHPGTVEGLVDTFDPKALIGAAPVPSRRAIEAVGELPVWVDLFGDLMAEAQAKALVQGGDQLPAYLLLLKELLERGDAFSTVSKHQKWAAVGQLGTIGRLNHATAGESMVKTLPCAVDVVDEPPSQGAADRARPARHDSPLADLDSEALVALWSGSFNTWCDVETLVAGLNAAMGRFPQLVLAVTGGAVDGHDEATYARFQTLVRESPHRERYLLLGHVSRAQLTIVRRRSAFGVVTERALYERELGSSGRIQELLAHGCPVVCTGLSELGLQVERHGLGRTYSAHDVESFADALFAMVMDHEARHEMAKAAARFCRDRLSIEATSRPLRDWAKSPSRAGDADLGPPELFSALGRDAFRPEAEALQRHADERIAHAENARLELRQHLDMIEGSKMWSLWTTWHGLLSGFRQLMGR